VGQPAAQRAAIRDQCDEIAERYADLPAHFFEDLQRA
jgi:hypothetical protein